MLQRQFHIIPCLQLREIKKNKAQRGTINFHHPYLEKNVHSKEIVGIKRVIYSPYFLCRFINKSPARNPYLLDVCGTFCLKVSRVSEFKFIRRAVLEDSFWRYLFESVPRKHRQKGRLFLLMFLCLVFQFGRFTQTRKTILQGIRYKPQTP